tara:strand:+ start:1160 stop:1759 length:600 start_codon:yes stop_codon:yes gene_type:complete
MDHYKGHIDVFPTRIYRLGFDKQLIPSDISSEELDNRGYADILNNAQYEKLNKTILQEASNFCPQHPNIGSWTIVGAWINKQKPGEEGFPFHSHSDSFMSCVFYVEGQDMALIVKEEARINSPSDSTKDCFFDIAIRHSWHPEVRLPIEPGELLLFPSYQLHKANRNTTNTDRISIAYNLFPSKTRRKSSLPWTMNLPL